jgi:hypothetical protein
MKKIEKLKRLFGVVLVAGTLVFSPLYLNDAHALFGSGITPEISNSIKMAKKSSGDVQKQILLKSADRSKTVDDIFALADAAKNGSECENHILLKGIKLAKTSKDFAVLADKASYGIFSDQIVLAGAKYAKTPADYNRLMGKACYRETKEAIAQISSGIKTDYIVPGSKCSPEIQAIFNGSYDDGLLEASLRKAKNVNDVVALGNRCEFSFDKDNILLLGRNLAVSADDYIALSMTVTSSTVRDMILSCGVSKAKTLEDFNKLSRASGLGTIDNLGRLFTAASGKGDPLEKSYNDMMAAYKKHSDVAASGVPLKSNGEKDRWYVEKDRLYKDFRDKYKACDKLASSYRVTEANSSPQAPVVSNSTLSSPVPDAASKKKAYEDMTNAYNAYKEAVGSDDPNADKLLSDYTKKLDAYSKMK